MNCLICHSKTNDAIIWTCKYCKNYGHKTCVSLQYASEVIDYCPTCKKDLDHQDLGFHAVKILYTQIQQFMESLVFKSVDESIKKCILSTYEKIASSPYAIKIEDAFLCPEMTLSRFQELLPGLDEKNRFELIIDCLPQKKEELDTIEV